MQNNGLSPITTNQEAAEAIYKMNKNLIDCHQIAQKFMNVACDYALHNTFYNKGSKLTPNQNIFKKFNETIKEQAKDFATNHETLEKDKIVAAVINILFTNIFNELNSCSCDDPSHVIHFELLASCTLTPNQCHILIKDPKAPCTIL